MKYCYFGLTCVFLLAACSAPQPIFYPNDHLKSVGRKASNRDIADCKRMAKQYGASEGPGKAAKAARSTAAGAGGGAVTGVVGGAIAGSAGRGAAIGAATGATAGLLKGLFSRPKPSQTYTAFVNRCLKERGYDVIGWE